MQRDRVALLCTAVIFLVHTAALALLFVPLSGLFDSQPVIEQDWGLHFHHLKSMETFWRQSSGLWGYNHWFMAGYPSNTIQDLSIKLFEIVSVIATGAAVDSVVCFKLLVFGATASIPWMLFFSLKNFFRDEKWWPGAALTAAALGTLYWWNSLPREMFFYGMIGFPLACYFSLLALSLLYRQVKSEHLNGTVACGWLLAATVLVPLHFQTILILAPPAIALWLGKFRVYSLKLPLWIGAAAVLSLLINLPWLTAAWTHRADDASTTIVANLPLFANADGFAFLNDYLRPGGYWSFRTSMWANGLRLVLLIAGSLGVYRMLRTKHRDIAIMAAAALAVLFFLTYFGSLIDVVRKLQPLRFKVPFDIFLVLACSYLISERIIARHPAGKSPWLGLLFIAGFLCALLNIVQTEFRGNMQLRTTVSPAVRMIVDWVGRETPADGRVLFEESGDETGFVYDGMYLSSFIPHWTGRQLIGGPINLYNDRHHFAEFHSGRLFQRDIATISNNELAAYFRLYNIGAVIAFHPRSVKRLLELDFVTLDRRLGDLYLLKVRQPRSWFIKGEGNLKASLDRIVGTDIVGDEVILKYHWIDGLKSQPSATIVPEKLLDDPIPFIKLIKPPAKFTLAINP